MDSSKFFPTAGETYNGAKLTADPRTFLTTIGPDGVWGNDAYWLGWIRPENLPGALCESRWDDGGSDATFYNYAKEQTKNYSIGYYALASANITNRRPGGNISYAYRQAQNDWILRPPNAFPDNDSYAAPGALLNAFYPQRDGVNCYESQITFKIFVRYGTSLPLNNFTSADYTIRGRDFCESAADFIAFCKGERPATFTVNVLNNYREFTFTPSDEPWQHYTDTWDNYMVDYYIGIVDYRFFGSYSKHRADEVPSCYPVPMIQDAFDNPAFGKVMVKAGHRGQLVYSVGEGANGASRYVEFIFHETSQTLETYTGVLGFAAGGAFIGGADGSFSKAEIVASPRTSGAFVVAGNCALRYSWANGTDRVYELHIARTTDDLFKHLALMPRVYWESNSRCIEGLGDDIFISEVLRTNEFTANLLTGTEVELGNQLRDWQKEDGNIADSNYTDEDKPEYSPPIPPEPDEDPTDYENNPSTQLRVPLFAQIGGHRYLSSVSEFSRVYAAVTKNITDWQEMYLMQIDGASTQLDLNKAEASFQAQVTLYKGLNSNPIDCISSVLAFPFDLTSYLAYNKDQLWRWGLLGFNGTDFSGGDGIYKEITGINGTTSGIVEGGTCRYFAEYKNFLDYEPYCSAEVYIPYCGSIAVDPKSYIGHILKVRYIVDFNTGACTALLFRDNLVVDQISGQMGIQIPMTAQDIMSYNSALFRGAQNLKSAKTSATAQGISAATSAFGAIGGAMATGNPFTGAGAFTSSFSGYLNSITREGSAQYELATTQMPFKEISHATPGTATGNEQSCRLVIYRPTFLDGYSKDAYGNYGHTTGFACLENKQLKNFHGLTVASGLDTSGISRATEKEKEAIANALKSGVYLP